MKIIRKILRRLKNKYIHETSVSSISSENYWTEHNVTKHKTFASEQESIDYLHWRNDQYVDYIKLLPIAGHDDEVIVDYGCGPGHDLVGFFTYSKPAKVYGIDVSSSSLKEARARLDVHNYPCEMMLTSETDETIPLDDNTVDYVHCSGVLNHVLSPERIAQEFHRILKPGGYVRLMVYNYHSIWVHLYVAHVLKSTDKRYRELSLDEAFRRSTDGFDCPISRNWTVLQMLKMAEKAGFDALHLGNAVSLFELSLLSQRFAPIMDPEFPAESREFLTKITLDHRGVPYVEGQVAGIDGCYELWKPLNEFRDIVKGCV